MNILSYNPGHDGALAYIKDARLVLSMEAEKNSHYRYSPISSSDVFNVLSEISEVPDILCTGGWWPRDQFEYANGTAHANYRGVSKDEVIVRSQNFLGKPINYFSSSHERSHILCAFGMSPLAKGTPCYALVWEGAIGSFYEIDSNLNIKELGEVIDKPGNRYSMLYGLADPSFPKNTPYFRITDAGKLMALASFSNRSVLLPEEKTLLDFFLGGPYRQLCEYEDIKHMLYRDAGVENPEFCNFAGIFSDKIFDLFYQFAKAKLKKGMPLIIAGGCGLNCDWNTKWKDTGFFSEVFVPPVANDSGSAIGTAIDAQFHFTGNPKIDWSVYSGVAFNTNGTFDVQKYDICEADCKMIADMLTNDLILGWVQGKYEIGPRALGNRSILAAPFKDSTRIRLNNIKQREQFRPIAPVCLQDDAQKWFGCSWESPYMLYTQQAKTNALAAVTHVNNTARIQTVSADTNQKLFKLLNAFKAKTGYGVLCNTSLNFNGKGFINKIEDLSVYTIEHGIDGFVVENKAYLLKSSKYYQNYRSLSKV